MISGTKGAQRRSRRIPTFGSHHKRDVKVASDVDRRRMDRIVRDSLGKDPEEIVVGERVFVDTWD